MASWRALWLGIQVDPFGVTGEIGTPAGDAGYEVQVGMEAGFGAERGIDKAGLETFDRDGCGDAPAELGDRVPDHALLLDIEVVEGGHMTAGGDHQVAGGEWAGMGHGDHEL
jgi:hypothetical protein